MKIEQVHYSDRFQEAFWHEEIDDISRYLRLAAEYGRTQEAIRISIGSWRMR